MIEKEHATSIRRILVALDASRSSPLLIEIAAQLAAAFGSELVGVFVEEIDLLRAAQLPFAREVSAFLHTCERLEPQELERQFRIQANLMARALESAARRLDVPWEFRVARGTAAEELLSAAAEADLVILGKVGRSLWGQKRLGSTTRMIVSRCRGLTLVVHQAGKPAIPVSVVYDGSATADRALEAAALLMEVNQGGLRLIIIADTQESAARLQSQALSWLSARGWLAGELRIVVRPSLSQIAWVLQSDGGGPVVVPSTLVDEQSLCWLVNEVPGPVLLVGETG